MRKGGIIKMKKVILLSVILLALGKSYAEEFISVPWNTFESLYRESVEREIMKTAVKPAAEKEPWLYSIEEAVYSLDVNDDTTCGEVLVSGKIISGAPEPIRLFGNDIIIDTIKKLSGGYLLYDYEADDESISLVCNRSNEFQVMFSFYVDVQEDNQSRFLSFQIPPALKNSLKFTLPKETRLAEIPGVVDADGICHFSGGSPLLVRFHDKQAVTAMSSVEIDTFSVVKLQERRVLITTGFMPVRPLPDVLTMHVPNNAQYISSSLKGSWIKKLKDGTYELRLPQDEHEVFSIQFAIDNAEDDGGFSFLLPSIKDNNGREGNFILQEPDDAQISLQGNRLVSQIPLSELKSDLRGLLDDARFYKRIPITEKLNITVARFESVKTPSIVLDSMHFYTSFEENGNTLSMLVLDVPPEAGARLKLKALEDRDIWSLTVNNRKRKVYMDENANWVIPLEGGQSSHVELAFIGKGEKLKLQGRLESVLPQTALPVRTVKVGISLPKRVNLLSIEGPVVPADGKSWKLPPDFIGKPYFFTRNFYKGEGLKMAVSYKEPAE
jgi:hypothetical protein